MRHVFAPLLMILAACGSVPPTRPPPTPLMDGKPTDDTIRLTTGEVIRGRIVEETMRQVVVERDQTVGSYPRAAIYSIEYAKERWQERRDGLKNVDPPAAEPAPAATWLPRSHPSEPVEQTEVLFYDPHTLADCVGPVLAKAHQDFPDVRLFLEPGGALVLHDPRRWGYHALLSGGALKIPEGEPGLTIRAAKDEASLPEWAAFISPAQEFTPQGADGRASYVLPDVVYAVVKPAAIVDTLLAIQPFAGGKPSKTANGALWAFSLPRNARQFMVYLYDGGRRHGEILKASYLAYGDTILAADLMIDMVGADGMTVGRVLMAPYPDGVAADGPAPEAVRVLAGPTGDPTTVAKIALPPRESVQAPSRAASMKADLLVTHYDVSDRIPQSLVLAHGVGRPAKEVVLTARELTKERSDEVVKIDLSALPEERFPAVAWLYQRRTFGWKSQGGMFRPGPALAAVPPAAETKLTRVKRSEGIPHVLPLLFTGPKPAAGAAAMAARGGDPYASVAGGMSTALMREAIGGGSGGGGLTQTLLPPSAPGGGDGGPGGGSVSNVTYVYITSPPHAPSSDAGAEALSEGPTGMNLSRWGPSNVGPMPARAATGGNFRTMGPIGTIDRSGVWRDDRGAVTYDPKTGNVHQHSHPATSQMTVDMLGRPAIPLKRKR